LKIRSFLSIQMHQLIIIMIPTKKLTSSWYMKDTKTSRGSQGGITRWIKSQHDCAKGRSIKRYTEVSSIWEEHSTQVIWGELHISSSRFLVLSLSFKSNQKKTLSLLSTTNS
jgi:hypothetical protein